MHGKINYNLTEFLMGDGGYPQHLTSPDCPILTVMESHETQNTHSSTHQNFLEKVGTLIKFYQSWWSQKIWYGAF